MMMGYLKDMRLKERLSPEIWLEEHFPLKCLIVFLALSLVKSRAFFPQGRFWAEEGTIFYTNICTAPGLEGLGFLFNNHLELWTNLGVLLSTLASLERAPAVSTLYAITLQFILLATIAAKRHQLGLSKTSVLVILVVAIGMPQSREVWANTINLHFHFAIVAALILAIPATGKGWARLSFLLLLMSGLSGIPANFLVPLFILVAIFERNRTRTIQALLLTATAALQVYLLLHNGYEGDRNLMPRFDVIVLASLTHSFFALIWSPIAGRFASDLLVPLVQPVGLRETLLGLVFLLASILLVARAFGPISNYRLQHREGQRNVRLAAAAAVLLAASITLAMGDRTNLVSSHYGGRYFFAPNVLVAIILLSLTGTPRRVRKLAILSLVLSSFAGVPRFYAGPDWRLSIASMDQGLQEDQTAIALDIWPHGWTMQVPLSCVEGDASP